MSPGVTSSIFLSSDSATIDCFESRLALGTNEKFYTNNSA